MKQQSWKRMLIVATGLVIGVGISYTARAECTAKLIGLKDFIGSPGAWKTISSAYLATVSGCIQTYQTHRNYPSSPNVYKIDYAKYDGSTYKVVSHHCEVQMQFVGETNYHFQGFSNSFLICNQLQDAYLLQKNVDITLLVKSGWGSNSSYNAFPGIGEYAKAQSQVNNGAHGIEDVTFEENK